jgi:lipopolysaccharide/colanic/teichoic acid biosynthesis glycosyltransferase
MTLTQFDYWYNIQNKKLQKNSTFVKFDDPSVTKVGKFIRNTSIDELPQLINVLKGDMSMGNRPLPVYEAELITGDEISKRFLAPPGIRIMAGGIKRKGGKCPRRKECVLTMNMQINLRAIIILLV